MNRFEKIGKALNFIEYISKDMKKDDMYLLYKINNIKRERLELLSDFVYSLNELILTTYLGDDITSKEDRDKHFNWCWDKVRDSFKKEGIYFLDINELYNYFLVFYQESFYDEEKQSEIITKIGVFWEELLNYSKVKTMSEYETLVELYRLFNKSFMVN